MTSLPQLDFSRPTSQNLPLCIKNHPIKSYNTSFNSHIQNHTNLPLISTQNPLITHQIPQPISNQYTQHNISHNYPYITPYTFKTSYKKSSQIISFLKPTTTKICYFKIILKIILRFPLKPYHLDHTHIISIGITIIKLTETHHKSML